MLHRFVIFASNVQAKKNNAGKLSMFCPILLTVDSIVPANDFGLIF